jgi:hypothetical protein
MFVASHWRSMSRSTHVDSSVAEDFLKMKALPPLLRRMSQNVGGTLAGNRELRRRAKLRLSSELSDSRADLAGDCAGWSFSGKGNAAGEAHKQMKGGCNAY